MVQQQNINPLKLPGAPGSTAYRGKVQYVDQYGLSVTPTNNEGAVVYMCGICQHLAHSEEEINYHVETAHENMTNVQQIYQKNVQVIMENDEVIMDDTEVIMETDEDIVTVKEEDIRFFQGGDVHYITPDGAHLTEGGHYMKFVKQDDNYIPEENLVHYTMQSDEIEETVKFVSENKQLKWNIYRKKEIE